MVVFVDLTVNSGRGFLSTNWFDVLICHGSTNGLMNVGGLAMFRL